MGDILYDNCEHPLKGDPPMKTFLRRLTAFLLCAAILSPTALASDALGSRIYG